MLENLVVSDVCVHEIFRRAADRRIVPAVHAVATESLSPEAMDAFCLRVTSALSPKSKALEMKISKFGAGSFHSIAKDLVRLPDGAFLGASRQVPDKLSEAQAAQNIPGGIVIVFRGTTGEANHPFLGVIKAEVQDGFRRRKDGMATFTEFVNDLFLTRATRLYKIGFMVCPAASLDDDNAWRCLVYDHQIAVNNREAAALYFYETFLGCSFLEDAAYETAKFFNLTREFANAHVPDRETRHGMTEAVYNFVKNERAPTFTVDEFSERYVPEPVQDSYQAFMRRKQFPDRAVRRDTAELKGRLRRRRFKYGTEIEFSTSPEAMADGRVTIASLPNDRDAVGEPQEMTVITIRDTFVKEV